MQGRINHKDTRTREKLIMKIVVSCVLRVLMVHCFIACALRERSAHEKRRGFLGRGVLIVVYHAKCANALLASAMRWTFSRRLTAAPSRLKAATNSSASF